MSCLLTRVEFWCVYVCVRARVCAKAPQLLLGSKAHFFAVVVVSPHPLLPRAFPRCPPCAFFRLADLPRGRLFYNRLLMCLLGSGLPRSRCNFP